MMPAPGQFILRFGFVVAFCSGPIQQREKIGEVLCKPIFRDQLHTEDTSNVYKLFVHPVWERFLTRHKSDWFPTKGEIEVFASLILSSDDSHYQMEKCLLQRRGNGASIPELKDWTGIEADIANSAENGIPQQPVTVDREFVVWWISRWKQQRYLYLNYGGGRVIYQQCGYEALDAQHKWLRCQEKRGVLKIFDAKLRAKMFEYFSKKHFLVPQKEIEEEFLNPEWLEQIKKCQ